MLRCKETSNYLHNSRKALEKFHIKESKNRTHTRYFQQLALYELYPYIELIAKIVVASTIKVHVFFGLPNDHRLELVNQSLDKFYEQAKPFIAKRNKQNLY